MPDYLSRNERKSTRRIAKQVVTSIVGQPELKYLDSGVVNTAAPSVTGATGYLASVIAGDQQNQRTGLEIRAKSLLIRWTFANTVASTAPITFRCIVGIDWKPILATTPQASDILQDPNQILSPINILQGNERFSILRDKTFILNPGSTAAGVAVVAGQYKTMKMFMRLSQTVAFVGYSANDYARGQPFYLVMGSSAGGSAGLYSFYARFRFTDV